MIKSCRELFPINVLTEFNKLNLSDKIIRKLSIGFQMTNTHYYMNTPYEYCEGKLGVKIRYLMSDKNRHEESLCIAPYRTLRKRLDSARSVEKELRRACFGNEALVLFSSLDRATKDKLTVSFGAPDTEIRKSWFAQNYQADREAFNFYISHTYGEENKKLDLKFVEQYTYNASVLNTVLLMKTNRKAYIKTLGAVSIDIWESLSRDVNAFREVAHNLPTNKNSLRRKVTQYAKEGYGCLISGKHLVKNATKVKTDEQVALIDELLAKHTNLDNAQVCNLYNLVAARIEWPTITTQTVANRKEKSNLVIFAGRNGVSALNDKLLMQNKRSKPSMPMLFWTLDGWDTELLYQKTMVDKKGYATTTYHNRLTMVVVLDPFNKYPVGYAIGTHETPELIRHALLNAIVHTEELFGSYFKPYQLQSDNYSIKTLTPLYEACSKYFTPAKVKNAKSKVIEPYFGYINKTYCQMFDNWSGFGVQSGSLNQPNSEMLNKIRNHFPDEQGCRKQLETIIIAERSKKQADFIKKWGDLPSEHRLPMTKENFLLTFGATTGQTNRLTGEGLKIKINGQTIFYDNFDLDFRKQSHIDWQVRYNPANLKEAIAVSPNGEFRFELEQKYIQPMALAEQSEDDAFQRQRIKNFNSEVTDFITNERQRNQELLMPLFENPLLNDTLTKHLLVDSNGQHKNQRSHQKNLQANATKMLLRQEKAIKKQVEKTWLEEQNEYIKNKVDLNKYLEI